MAYIITKLNPALKTSQAFDLYRLNPVSDFFSDGHIKGTFQKFCMHYEVWDVSYHDYLKIFFAYHHKRLNGLGLSDIKKAELPTTFAVASSFATWLLMVQGD